MIARGDIEREADAFWRAVGGRYPSAGPVDVPRALRRRAPSVVVEFVPDLSCAVARVRLRGWGAPWRDLSDRPLRACMVADQGVAVILVDASDPDDERRFSIAHELAHLLLHYERPRREALEALGPAVTPVLDRRRPATRAERFAAALRDVSLAPYQHALLRGLKPDRRVAVMEAEADAMATELLAPWREASTLGVEGAALAEVLRARFGLPNAAARDLACQIGGPSDVPGVIRLFGRKSDGVRRTSTPSPEEGVEEQDDDATRE